MNKTKKNSGFSIMETIIALAIIVLVTVAALTIVMGAISARVKVTSCSEAQDFAHNVLECFKASDDNTEFENNVGFAGYMDLSEIKPDEQYYFENNKFTAKIVANCENGEFEIDIKSNKGEEIISFSYQRGAK